MTTTSFVWFRNAVRIYYPQAVCLHRRYGWAVYSRRWGFKLSDGKTRREAWGKAVLQAPFQLRFKVKKKIRAARNGQKN